MKKVKRIVSRHTCESLLALVNMGRVRIVKEHTTYGPAYMAISLSGYMIGEIGPRYVYMFEKKLSERGSGDGLFEGCSQTTKPAAHESVILSYERPKDAQMDKLAALGKRYGWRTL